MAQETQVADTDLNLAIEEDGKLGQNRRSSSCVVVRVEENDSIHDILVCARVARAAQDDCGARHKLCWIIEVSRPRSLLVKVRNRFLWLHWSRIGRQERPPAWVSLLGVC